MPTYEVYIHCVLCAGEHRLLMRVHLDDGPDRKQSVAGYFTEGSVPPQILAIRGHDGLCLKTGKKFKLENDDQLLLVPTTFVETRLS
jgi:hypothetical protein